MTGRLVDFVLARIAEDKAEPRVEVDEVTDAHGRPVKVVRLYDGSTLLDEQRWLVVEGVRT